MTFEIIEDKAPTGKGLFYPCMKFKILFIFSLRVYIYVSPTDFEFSLSKSGAYMHSKEEAENIIHTYLRQRWRKKSGFLKRQIHKVNI